MRHSAGGSTPSQAAARGGLRGIAQRLIKHSLLSEAQAAAAVADSLNLDIPLLQHVVERELVTPAEAAVAAGYEYGLPVINLESVLINALPPAADYPVRVLQSLNVVPLAHHGHRLTVAVPYPATLTQLDELQFATGLSIEGVLAPMDQLASTLNSYLALAQNEHRALDEFTDLEDEISSLNIAQDGSCQEICRL